MENFFKSFNCISRNHCSKCRNDIEFRRSIRKYFSGISDDNFECPYGFNQLKTPSNSLPSKRKMVKNLVTSAIKVGRKVISGKSIKVSDEEIQRRKDICNKCEEFFLDSTLNERCSKCGCVMKFKRILTTEHCELNKW